MLLEADFFNISVLLGEFRGKKAYGKLNCAKKRERNGCVIIKSFTFAGRK